MTMHADFTVKAELRWLNSTVEDEDEMGVFLEAVAVMP